MTSDIILDGDAVKIVGKPVEIEGGVTIWDLTVRGGGILNADTHSFQLDNPARRSGKRTTQVGTLVHEYGDKLFINAMGNYKGGVTIWDLTVRGGGILDIDTHTFIMDCKPRRTKSEGSRRALVHDNDDKLVINYGADYPGGVEINDIRKLTSKYRFKPTAGSPPVDLGYSQDLSIEGGTILISVTPSSIVVAGEPREPYTLDLVDEIKYLLKVVKKLQKELDEKGNELENMREKVKELEFNVYMGK